MKFIGFCGALTEKRGSCPSERLLLKAFEGIKEEVSAECEMIWLADYHVLPCLGCGDCMKGVECLRVKSPKDDLMAMIEKCYDADGFIFSVPVTPCGGLFYNVINLWARWRLIFEKEHGPNWGIEVPQIEENPFKVKPVANILSFMDSGDAHASFFLTGRNEQAYKFSTIVSLGVRVGRTDSKEEDYVLDDSDLQAAKYVGKRFIEVLSSELCDYFVQMVCDQKIV